jgi:hypothetical protein
MLKSCGRAVLLMEIALFLLRHEGAQSFFVILILSTEKRAIFIDFQRKFAEVKMPEISLLDVLFQNKTNQLILISNVKIAVKSFF